MFSLKRWTFSWTERKTDNTGIIKRLPGSGHLQRTDMHFSRRSYLIILLTEVTRYVVSHAICSCESAAFLLG